MPLASGQAITLTDGAQSQYVGSCGAPNVANRQMDVSVTNTTDTIIASFTTPATYGAYANVPVRCSIMFNIPLADANSGVITLKVFFTDPFLNVSSSLPMDVYEAPIQTLLAQTLTKGGGPYHTIPLMIETKPGTGVEVHYQNTAAGAISDTVTAIIELL